ncbi:hypothetical protein [Amorphus sp. 3PC139-8]|uniref:hypothetical protein n=1 Tax=Amorphus sp. 3PC139-8 TaxID=2735676 RepID=UPI00345CBEEE
MPLVWHAKSSDPTHGLARDPEHPEIWAVCYHRDINGSGIDWHWALNARLKIGVGSAETKDEAKAAVAAAYEGWLKRRRSRARAADG